MTRKGYSNITVKAGTFYRFVSEVERAKDADATIDNSRFLEILLGGRKSPVPRVSKEDRALTRHGGPQEILKLSSRLGVAKLAPKITRIYQQTRSSSPKREYLVGSAVYIACKQSHIPKTLDEIAEASGLDRDELFSYASETAMRLGLSISGTDPSAFVQRIADRVNSRGFKYKISKKSINDAKALLESLRDEPAVAGRSPMTVASWALYRACKQNRDNVSQKSIASAAEIVDTNMQRISSMLET